MASILIVDDLISIHEMLEAVIHPTGHKTAFATDGEKGLARYKAEKFDLVLADIDMKPMDGITLLKRLKQYDPGAVVIIMTAYASTESAIQALKYGAFDYLQKPFKVDELMQALKRSLEFRQAIAERELLGGMPAVKAGDFEARLVGESQKIKRLIAQLKKLATAHTTVLVSGEAGSGHEIAAELLHAARNTADSPMVRIDCRLCSEQSLRTGLLGENGAGGTWVQQAKGGTLFLYHLQALAAPDARPELVSCCATSPTSAGSSAPRRRISRSWPRPAFSTRNCSTAWRPCRSRCRRCASAPRIFPALLKSIAAKVSNPQFDARQLEFTADALATLKAYGWPGNLDEFNQVISQVITTTETRVITSAQLRSACTN